MPHRDNDWNFGGGHRRERDRDHERRDQRGYGEREDRSFGEAGRYNSDEARYGDERETATDNWRQRSGARYDQDRAGYGYGQSAYRGQEYGISGESGGYGAPGGRTRYAEPSTYRYGHGEEGAEGGWYGQGGAYRQQGGGQSGEDEYRGSGQGRYGSGAGGNAGRQDQGPSGRYSQAQSRQSGSRAQNAPYGDPRIDTQARGVEEFGIPHDYGLHPHQGHEFDPDYVSWRDEQLRNHDRDYASWRAEQHRRYDDDYRAFQNERRSHFGRSFSEWRNQRQGGGASGSAADASAQGSSLAGGASSATPNQMLPDRGAFGGTGGSTAGQASAGGGTPFDQTASQVQAATDGPKASGDNERRDDGEATAKT